MEAEDFERKKLNKKEEEEKALLNALYQDVNRLKDDSSEDEDPANTVCPYFKQGLCQRGKKCIYSHDLTLDRTEEIDLYVDQRTQLIMNKIGDNDLNDMSEVELNKIINQKEKNFNTNNKTDIVCRFFLEAVEKGKYGWNWNCRNGDKCHYKHCLPPGYKLKKDAAKGVQEKEDIEAKIDEERNNLLNTDKVSKFMFLCRPNGYLGYFYEMENRKKSQKGGWCWEKEKVRIKKEKRKSSENR